MFQYQMNLLRYLRNFLLLFSSCFFSISCLCSNVLLPSSTRVRVKIAQAPIREQKTWDVHISGPVLLADEQAQGKKISGKTLTISYKKGGFYINGKACLRKDVTSKKMVPTSCIRLLVQPGGHCTYNNHQYHGHLEWRVHQEDILLINVIDLEEYVYAVVCAESMPYWPLEIQKVQAILTRSYVLATMGDMERRKQPYHVTNTNLHQVYKGNIGEFKQVRTAVQQTAGYFLAHEHEPIQAMFDICCGGIVTQHIEGVDFQKAPYLARKYACKYCKHYSHVYSWCASFDRASLERHLHQYIPELKRLERVIVTKRDKAGLVREVLIQGKSGLRKYVSGQQWYRWFKEVKSFVFTIKRRGAIFHIQGTGMGHHQGYCQWGGRRMVDLGFNHSAILNYYYPGTQLKRLQKQ